MSGDAHFGHLPVVFMTPLRSHRDASLPGIKWAVGTHEIIQDTLSRKEGGVRRHAGEARRWQQFYVPGSNGRQSAREQTYKVTAYGLDWAEEAIPVRPILGNGVSARRTRAIARFN